MSYASLQPIFMCVNQVLIHTTCVLSTQYSVFIHNAYIAHLASGICYVIYWVKFFYSFSASFLKF